MTQKHPSASTPPESIEELRDVHAWCAAILERVSEGILVAEVNSLMIKYENPSICRMLGYSSEELERMSIRQIHPESEWPHVLSDFQAQARGEKTLAVNIACRRKDGTIIYVDIATTTIVFGGEECNVGFFRDVTEHKRMAEALQDSEEKFRLMSRLSPAGLYLTTPAGECLYVNDAWCKMAGLASEEALGRGWIRGLHPDDRQSVQDNWGKMVAARGQWGQEYRFRTGEGKITWVYGVAAAQEDSDGNVVRYVGVNVDITERKRMEEVLRDSEARFRALVEQSLTGICIIQEGQFAYVNPRLAEMLGYAEGEMIGRSPTDFVVEADRELVRTNLLKRLRGEVRSIQYEFRARRKDGAELHLEVFGGVMSYQGKPAIVATVQDVTARQQAEEALRKSEYLLKESQLIAGVGSYVLDITTGLWSSSDVLDKVFGIDEAFLRNVEGWILLVHPDDRTMMAGYFRNEVLGQGRAFDKEYRIIRHNDRAARWVYGRGRLEFDVQGHPLKMIGTIQDVTDRKRVEEELRRMQDLLNQTQVLSRVGGWEYDVTTRRNVWTDEMYRIYGVDPSAFDPNDIPQVASFFASEDRPAIVEAFRRAVEVGEPYDLELKFTNARGERLWVRAVGQAERKEGRIVRVFGNFMDITERKRAEDAIRALSHRLSQAQDEERRRVARELHDSVAQQLAAVTMNLGMLEDLQRSKSVKIRKLLHDSLELVEHCSQEVRTVSYLLHPPLLDQMGLAAALRSYVEGFSRRSGIRVTVEVPANLGRFLPEVELALFRVVQESLGNVHRHSGSSVARVRLVQEPDRLVVEVADEGHGMPPAILKSVQEGGAATGMGVASMRERLRQLGEDLHIESGSRGTTIRATIRLTGMDS